MQVKNTKCCGLKIQSLSEKIINFMNEKGRVLNDNFLQKIE